MHTKTKHFVILFYCFFPFSCFSQQQFAGINFSATDSMAKSIQYDNDIYKLTQELTATYTKDIYKIRAIFIWITENIKYDYKFINKGKEIKGPDCEGSVDCTNKIKEWENNYIKNVLKKKKGICDGYARVFKRMCDIAGIKTEIVSGYTKTKPYQIGTSFSVNHAWNAVMIDSNWYFLDATWAAGYCVEDEETEKLTKYVRSYENYYWLTAFEKLKRNHFPQKGEWVQEPNFTKEKFSESPYYSRSVIDKINVTSPNSGIIPAKKGDTIHFKFSYEDTVKHMQVNSNIYANPSIYTVVKATRKVKYYKLDTFALRKQQYLSPKRTGNTYEFDYVVTENSLYYLDILFDYRRVMRFKVRTGN